MVRGGKRQTYVRDARGRFASAGGGKKDGALKGGTLAQRSSLRRSRAKAAASPSPQQRGAVTRGNRKLQSVKAAAQRRISASRATISKPKGLKPRGIGTKAPANKIARTPSLKAPRNTVKSYRPKTVGGLLEKARRVLGRDVRATGKPAKEIRKGLKKQSRRLSRFTARSLANRLGQGIEGRLARMELSVTGQSLINRGLDVIRDRSARASAAAARGSKAAARARDIYASQLAGMGPGKPKRDQANTVKPGPRNTKGPPPKKHRRKRQ
jgi:hypothetical protein